MTEWVKRRKDERNEKARTYQAYQLSLSNLSNLKLDSKLKIKRYSDETKEKERRNERKGNRMNK